MKVGFGPFFMAEKNIKKSSTYLTIANFENLLYFAR